MAKYYEDFKAIVMGKAYDIDGYYSAQCWDGAMYYSKWLGYPVFHCGITGYAEDIWTQRKTNGILKYYDEVSVYQPGDIVTFKKYPGWTPLSHIAIFDHDIDGVYGMFLGQNQGGAGGAFNLAKFPYAATTPTGFRPKNLAKKPAAKPAATGAVLNSKPSDFVYETATFTVTVDKIKIRKAPSLSGQDTGMTYNKGMSVIYDGYVKREGYVWISWISGSTRERRWMAVRETKTNKAYGTFR